MFLLLLTAALAQASHDTDIAEIQALLHRIEAVDAKASTVIEGAAPPAPVVVLPAAVPPAVLQQPAPPVVLQARAVEIVLETCEEDEPTEGEE